MALHLRPRAAGHIGHGAASAAPLLRRPVPVARFSSGSPAIGTHTSLSQQQRIVPKLPFSGAAAVPQFGARRRAAPITRSGLSDLLPVALFFAPGLSALVYAYFKGKGNLKDGLSRLLTEVSQGYFQPDVGGENIPVAEGELSDLAGDEPLFKALYKWCAQQACEVSHAGAAHAGAACQETLSQLLYTL